MNPVPFILLAISLPLLLGGCGEKHEGVSEEELEVSEGIICFKGSDTAYTGKSYAVYPNGQKKDEGNIKYGKLDGLSLGWYENGQKELEINYKDGKYDGLAASWHENGQKEKEINYKDGKQEGLATFWHENGQKSFESNWKDGEPVEGSEKFWNSKGEPVDSFEEAEK